MLIPELVESEVRPAERVVSAEVWRAEWYVSREPGVWIRSRSSSSSMRAPSSSTRGGIGLIWLSGGAVACLTARTVMIRDCSWPQPNDVKTDMTVTTKQTFDNRLRRVFMLAIQTCNWGLAARGEVRHSIGMSS